MQTYNCPYANHGFSRFSRHTWRDWSFALLIVIEKASRTWNCNRLNCNDMSVGIKLTGRREMRTSRFDLPFRRFTYVTAHSPTLLSLHQRHSSFYNSSVASPTHTHFTYVTRLAAHDLKLDKNDEIILKYEQQPTILYLKIQLLT